MAGLCLRPARAAQSATCRVARQSTHQRGHTCSGAKCSCRQTPRGVSALRTADRHSAAKRSSRTTTFARAAVPATPAAATGTGPFASWPDPLAQVAWLVCAGIAFFAVTAVLNALRALVRAAWEKSLEARGPGSLLTALLGVLLNVFGMDIHAHSAAPGGAVGAAVGAAGAAAGDAAGKVESSVKSVTGGVGSSPAGDGDVASRLGKRTEMVQKHFADALSADDFLARVEVSLAAYGFRGDNSLALTNVCRDESTGILKEKIDEIFGQCFNINGLGAVLTCGVTGIGAGLSHAPIDAAGRERYVFFAFPHIAVDEQGEAAAIFRPGRTGKSSACGALLFATNAVKESGLDEDPEGVHDHKEPEASILMNRLKRQIRSEGRDPAGLDVVELTKIANRVITSDLEGLISKAVKDTEKADYAVITGVQIHSWPRPSSNEPVIEFVQPTTAYVVMKGKRVNLDLGTLPALTPRQLSILALGQEGVDGGEEVAGTYLRGTTVTGVDAGTDILGLSASGASVQSPQGEASGRSGKQAGHEVPDWASRYSVDVA